MKRYFRTTVILTISVLLAGCSSAADDLSFTDSDREAIRSLLNGYASGWNASDPEQAILSLFTENPVLLPHHGAPQVEGKEALRNHFWPAGLAGFRVNSYDFEVMEITGSADQAYSRGRFSISFTFEENGGKLRTLGNAGNYVMIFRKEGEEWKISRYIWNDPVPLEE